MRDHDSWKLPTGKVIAWLLESLISPKTDWVTAMLPAKNPFSARVIITQVRLVDNPNNRVIRPMPTALHKTTGFLPIWSDSLAQWYIDSIWVTAKTLSCVD